MIEVREGPDRRRPRSPWPRLIFAPTVLVGSVALAVTSPVAVSSSIPDRELRFEFGGLQTDTPRFEPVIDFGSDRLGFTYGAWVVRLSDGSVRAYLSRDVASACRVDWLATAPSGAGTATFADRCGRSDYSLLGDPIAGDAARGLDRLPVTSEGSEIVVNLERVELGPCRPPNMRDCSNDGEQVIVELSGALNRVPGRP
jgi:hypothetical protein